MPECPPSRVRDAHCRLRAARRRLEEVKDRNEFRIIKADTENLQCVPVITAVCARRRISSGCFALASIWQGLAIVRPETQTLPRT